MPRAWFLMYWFPACLEEIQMILKGKVHKFGSNVDTDVIIPARFLNVSEPMELAKHCMEDIDPEFISKIKKGDINLRTNLRCSPPS